MNIQPTEVTNLIWANAEESAINMLVQFEHLPIPVEFTARADDPEEHGRRLFAKALAGDYGEVQDYMPPTELEIARAANPTRRKNSMRRCIEKVQHWDMFAQPEKVQEWKLYYQALANLEESESWPIVEAWPTAPAE